MLWIMFKLGYNAQYPYMFIIFEKGMRGGISFISNRYSEVSNKYLKSYDPKQ